jgi:T4 bacteriophage base plate protein
MNCKFQNESGHEMRNEGPRQSHCVRGDERTFLLPLGYVDCSGRCHREVQVKPITGREQQLLSFLSSRESVATITTELLARCVGRVGEIQDIDRELMRELLAGDREFLLLRIYQTTFGDKLDLFLHCPNLECGAVTEAPLNLNDFTVEANPVAKRTFTMKLASRTGKEISFRFPTGADQEALAAARDLDDGELSKRLLERCIVDTSKFVEKLTPNQREEIEKRMKRLAPGIEVELEATCPKCSRSFASQLDVPLLVLNEMRLSEAALDGDVHALAFYYHWPESEIISLTPRRRARYVELLGEELERIAN